MGDRIRKQSTNQKILVGAAFGIAAFFIIFFIFLAPTKQVSASMLQQNFAYISTVHTSLCSYGIDKALNFVSPLPNSSHIQGSCCSAMVYSRYAQQVQEIAQNYSNTPFIFRDPYNVSVSLAKELLAYDQNTTLTPQQQAVYDQAVNMSKDHGPCCCQCWRWYALEGQAKYYIKNLNYNASTIAKLWGLEEGCGGL